jgi:uncharacterized lipoprotein YehR (DUF1307 family)
MFFFLVAYSRFFGLGEALEYREHFLGLAVVLCESGVLEIDGCDEDEESEDDDREGEGMESDLSVYVCDHSTRACTSYKKLM